MSKAVFLDRDGVINEEVNHLYRKEDLVLLPKVGEAIKLLNEKQYLVIVITNQSAVAKGICTEEDVKELNNHMKELLQEEGAKIDAVYYCPHHPNEGKNPFYTRECECRKPKPGMLIQAGEDFNLEDLSECFLIGDKNGDILAGKRAGCRTILVSTGYGGLGGDNVSETIPTYRADNLYYAVTKIILK